MYLCERQTPHAKAYSRADCPFNPCAQMNNQPVNRRRAAGKSRRHDEAFQLWEKQSGAKDNSFAPLRLLARWLAERFWVSS